MQCLRFLCQGFPRAFNELLEGLSGRVSQLNLLFLILIQRILTKIHNNACHAGFKVVIFSEKSMQDFRRLWNQLSHSSLKKLKCTWLAQVPGEQGVMTVGGVGSGHTASLQPPGMCLGKHFGDCRSYSCCCLHFCSAFREPRMKNIMKRLVPKDRLFPVQGWALKKSKSSFYLPVKEL